jgi:hypothetical protein
MHLVQKDQLHFFEQLIINNFCDLNFWFAVPRAGSEYSCSKLV